MKKNVSILIFLLMFCGCTNPFKTTDFRLREGTNNYTIIDLNSNDSILWDSILSNGRYMPLEISDSCLIGDGDKLLFLQDTIYILKKTVQKTISSFDIQDDIMGADRRASGEYLFKVKARNGLLNLERPVKEARMLLPFWRTKWTLIFYGTIFMGTLVWFLLNSPHKTKTFQNTRQKSIPENAEHNDYASEYNFYSNLANEIHTQLSLIKLPLEQLMQSGDGMQRTKEFLTAIEKNTNYLLVLINQLLDLSKNEGVEFKLNIERIGVSDRLKDFFERFHESADGKVIALNSNDMDFMNRLNKALEKHMSDPNFSIDVVCEEVTMSRSNFYRKIKDIYGLSPHDYIKMIRLKHAAELLLQDKYRIIEVCEKVGFSSSSYFAKCFKGKYGVLPREFVLKNGKIETVNE